jgi:16S rRNA processing protein RimM
MGYIPVGRVVSTRGLRGEIRFQYYNDSETSLYQYRSFFADCDGRKVQLRPSQIESRRGYFLIQFGGLETPSSVSFLIGKELFVKEEDLPGLSEGEYYDYQLIGLKVIDENGKSLGQVREIIHTKANDIIVIKGEKELLVPMQEEFVLDIDVGAASIRVSEGAVIE